MISSVGHMFTSCYSVGTGLLTAPNKFRRCLSICQLRHDRFIMNPWSRVGLAFLKNPAKDSRHASLGPGSEFTEAATHVLATFTPVKDTNKYGCDAGTASVKLQTFFYCEKKRDRDVDKGFIHILVQAFSSKQVLTTKSHQLRVSCLTLLCHQLPYFLLPQPLHTTSA